MKIYDGFLFNDELDLLDLRMREIGDLVDTFILVEVPWNFMQVEKPLHFERAKIKFLPYLEKIRHIVPNGCPVGPHPAIEWWQRQQIALGFQDADEDDVILIGDVDEIPDRKLLLEIRKYGLEEPITMVQKLYYYYVNCFQMQPWLGTVAMPRRVMSKVDCQDIRNKRCNFPRRVSGWHFSWLGPYLNIKNKLESIDVVADNLLFGGGQMDKPDSTDEEKIRGCFESGGDLFGRTDEIFSKQFVDIKPGVNHPEKIMEWLADHPEYEKKL